MIGEQTNVSAGGKAMPRGSISALHALIRPARGRDECRLDPAYTLTTAQHALTCPLDVWDFWGRDRIDNDLCHPWFDWSLWILTSVDCLVWSLQSCASFYEHRFHAVRLIKDHTSTCTHITAWKCNTRLCQVWDYFVSFLRIVLVRERRLTCNKAIEQTTVLIVACLCYHSAIKAQGFTLFHC